MTGCWKHHHALHHWTENGNLSSYKQRVYLQKLAKNTYFYKQYN